MLSGGPGFSTSYLNAAAEHFAQKNTVVLFDQRGTGRSTVSDGGAISIETNVEDLEALREELGGDPLRFYGHSWGAMLTMIYAARYPTHVAAMVLSDSGGPDMSFADAFSRRLEARMTAADRKAMAYWGPLRSGPDGAHASEEYFKAQLGAYVDDRSQIPVLLDPADTHVFDVRVSRAMFADLDHHYDVKEGLKSVSVPTLIVLGRDDPIGIATAQRLHGLIEGSSLEVIDSAAHFPWADRPAAYYAVVDAFLAAH